MSITRMRYPGGDPENGPAYLQKFVRGEWKCARHQFRDDVEYDPETGDEFVSIRCRHCGEYANGPLKETT